MSAVQGPTPFTATSARCASGAGKSRERREVEAPVAPPPRATAVSARIFGPERPQARRPASPAGEQRFGRRAGCSAASSRPKIAVALATDTCCETMIAASPAKPGSRRRSGGGPPTSTSRPMVSRSSASSARGGLGERRLAVDEAARLVAQAAPARRAGGAASASSPRCRRGYLGLQPCRSSASRRRPTACSISGTPIPPCATPNSRRGSAVALLLRFEDTDPARCRPEFEAAIVEDLGWLGVACEPHPRRQSEHADDYAAAFAALDRRGLVYPCFCTRGQIAAVGDGARSRRRGAASRALRRRRPRGDAARGSRAANPPTGGSTSTRALAAAPSLSWTEFYEGDAPTRVAAEPERWGDILIAAKERPAVYHLAVVVDDALQGVTDVVRGRDLFASTSLHRLLQALLDLPAPRYRHHRLVLDARRRETVEKREVREPARPARAGVFAAAEVRAALGFGMPRDGRLAVALS